MVTIELVDNLNQRQRVMVKIDPSLELLSQIWRLAKNKLRMKKPSRIFIRGSEVIEIHSSEELIPYLVDRLEVFVSTHVNYIGVVQPLHQAPILTLDRESLVDEKAIRQLELSSRLPGMVRVVGMPDLHVGPRFPIGPSFLVQDMVYPALIGGDIGCGMTMHALSVHARQIQGNEKSIATLLRGLDDPMPDIRSHIDQAGLTSTEIDVSLGTIGKGNHFAEIQIVDRIFDDDIATSHHLIPEKAFLLVHSGSRGLGKSILEKYGNMGLQGSKLDDYLSEHNQACKWARVNRALIADRVVKCLDVETEQKVLDIWHNHVELVQTNGKTLYLHRKGAAPTDQGLVAIPGSRGTLTYIVQGINDQANNLWSVAHGAGRVLSRQEALSKFTMALKADRSKLEQNSFGGIVICNDDGLLREEAPAAYKDIDVVVQDLVSQGLVKIVATMKPLITYKTRSRQ
jgi:release factor H-coupled RctB family protein